VTDKDVGPEINSEEIVFLCPHQNTRKNHNTEISKKLGNVHMIILVFLPEFEFCQMNTAHSLVTMEKQMIVI
jgi:hypothetical protein